MISLRSLSRDFNYQESEGEGTLTEESRKRRVYERLTLEIGGSREARQDGRWGGRVARGLNYYLYGVTAEVTHGRNIAGSN